MSQGSEVVLLLTKDQLKSLLTAGDLEELAELGDENSYQYLYELAASADWVVKDALLDLHRKLLTRFGTVSIIQTPGLSGPARTQVTLPNGETQEFRTFGIDTFGTENDRASYLGISLWSRYMPIWLDWKHPYGGSGAAVVFNDETMDLIQEARTAISAVIPAIATSDIAVIQQFY